MLDLRLPKKKHAKEKLNAYKRHWAAIAVIQGELNSQWIHQGISDGGVASNSQLCVGTVRRFRQWGRGSGKQAYSYFHGPNFTTVIGIADALDLDIKVVPRKKNGKG